MNTKAKEPVKLRFRTIANGNTSIYLDIYLNHHRSYEFLKLYLVPEKTRADKEHNRQIMGIAEAVKAQRVLDIQNGRFGFLQPSSFSVKFFDYYKKVMSERRGQTQITWKTTLSHLRAYEPDAGFELKDADEKWVKGFIAYLKTTGNANNTIRTYVCKLRCCFNQAVKENILQRSPFKNIRNLQLTETERLFLSPDEVRMLAGKPCPRDVVKRAFLFGCLSGMRFSDIHALRWEDVRQVGDFTRITFRQKKTGGQEYLDIPAQARSLMGERSEPGSVVFVGLPKVATTDQILAKWVNSAGIDKHITFHCSRHTFAVMMLDLTSDIYTVSKLLGHRDISTTQVYAKMLDKNKQKAVAMIPDLLGE